MLIGTTTLFSASSSIAVLAAGQSSNQSGSLLGSLSRFAFDLGRRELNDVVLPRVHRSVNTLLYRVPVTELSTEAILSKWEALSVNIGESWIDIGSGNADSLGRLAARHDGQFIGIEKENSLPLFLELKDGAPHVEALPNNVHYYVLTMNKPGREALKHKRLEQVRVERMQPGDEVADVTYRTTLDLIGRGTASVVSLIFPYTEPAKMNPFGRIWRGAAPKPLHYQLRTALDLLKSGGTGVAILEAGPTAEQLRVLERTLNYLRSQADVASVQYNATALDVEHLDIAAYAPQKDGEAMDTEALTTGTLVFFRRK